MIRPSLGFAVLVSMLPGSSRAGAQELANLSARFLASGGETTLEISAECGYPDGTIVTILTEGLWPDPAGLLVYAGLPEGYATVAGGRVSERIVALSDLIPGRYRITAEIVPLSQRDLSVAAILARKRPPPPITAEAFAGTTEDALRRLTSGHAELMKRTEEADTLMADLEAYARGRQRIDKEEERLKTKADALYLDLKDATLDPRPPFARSSATLCDLLFDLLVVVPAHLVDDQGNSSDVNEDGKPNDPQAVFADDRIEKGIVKGRQALTRARAGISREYAGALMAEIERIARWTVEAHRLSGRNPRELTETLRHARLALSRLQTATGVPEANAGGASWGPLLERLQALTDQVESTPPEPGGVLPAVVAKTLNDLEQALQAARGRLAS